MRRNCTSTWGRFRSDLDSHKFKQSIEEDTQLGDSVSVEPHASHLESSESLELGEVFFGVGSPARVAGQAEGPDHLSARPKRQSTGW